MHIILFEDVHTPQLFPATIARPAFALNVGTYRLIDLALHFGDAVEVIARPYLRMMVNLDYPDLWVPDALSSKIKKRNLPLLVINARVVPHVDLIQKLHQAAKQGKSGIVRTSNGIACALLAEDHPVGNPFPNDHLGSFQLLDIIEEQNLPPLDIEVPILRHVHDIIRYHPRIMNDNLNHRLRQTSSVVGYTEIADGVFTAGTFANPTLTAINQRSPCGTHCSIQRVANDAAQFAFCTTDTTNGPVVFETGVRIGPFCHFRGPVYVEANANIIEYAALKDCVSVGNTTKIGGEVEVSIIEAYTNKQHHGFLGHSYLGSWINLGAGTSNSDLKNTYGDVVMDYAGNKVKTGMQFVGSFIGDYSKTAINTSIFTGKIIGACSMLYGFVTTNVPSFVNYARTFGQVTETSIETWVATQARMFDRRNVQQRPCDVQLLRDIYEMTKHERQLASEPLSL